jgi:hypothetical protein
VKFSTSVQGADSVVDEIEKDIEDGIEKSVGKRSSDLTSIDQQVKMVAKERIRDVGAVWTGDLVSSFDVDHFGTGDSIVVTIENTSDHAAPIEYGAEYDEEGPPVAALIPWVMTKMSGFTLPEDQSELPDTTRADELEIETTAGSVDLGASVPDEILEKAFWLQRHIKEEGIDAVRYMEMAEMWAEKNSANTVAEYISAELKT